MGDPNDTARFGPVHTSDVTVAQNTPGAVFNPSPEHAVPVIGTGSMDASGAAAKYAGPGVVSDDVDPATGKKRTSAAIA